MTARAVIVLPGQGPVWNMEAGRPTTFKILSEQSDGSIAVFDEIVPVGGGTPFHIHPISDEVIHILSGDFTFKIGDQFSKVGAGTWVMIPHGTAHAWKNTGSEAGSAFFIFTPAQNAQFFEELRKFDLPMWSIDPKDFEQYAQRYGYEMVDMNPFD